MIWCWKEREIKIIPKEFGRMVSRLMANRNMIQADLAERAGTAQSVISAIVNGKRKSGRKVMTNLANALELTGEERINFFPIAILPSTTENPLVQNIFGQCISQCTTNGIDINNIASVTPTTNATVIVMRNGSIYNLHMRIESAINNP